jgi:multidrug resistance efflux pump
MMNWLPRSILTLFSLGILVTSSVSCGNHDLRKQINDTTAKRAVVAAQADDLQLQIRELNRKVDGFSLSMVQRKSLEQLRMDTADAKATLAATEERKKDIAARLAKLKAEHATYMTVYRKESTAP